MPNPALTEKIRNLPPLLDSLERDAEVSDLLRRSDAARERFRQMFPLDGVEQSALEDYRKEWMARYVYNSNAIEGSTLTLEDTELVLEGEFVPTDSPARYIFAARGVADGMAYAERFAEEERTLSVEMIQKLHEVTALDMQPALRGRFRPYGYQARITATRVKTADPLGRGERFQRPPDPQSCRIPRDVREHPSIHGRQRANRATDSESHAHGCRLPARSNQT